MGKPIDFSKEDNLEEKKGLFCCWRKGDLNKNYEKIKIKKYNKRIYQRTTM